MCHFLAGDESFIDKTLQEISTPLYDIITGRNGINRKHYLFAKDRTEVLQGVL